MTHEDDIKALEDEWSPEKGFFWKARLGQFASADFERALSKLAAISCEDEALLPRRFVALVWYIPVFMAWQIERIRESGRDVEAVLTSA